MQRTEVGGNSCGGCTAHQALALLAPLGLCRSGRQLVLLACTILPATGLLTCLQASALPQDSAFVLELTYNYEVKGYRLGNDHVYFKIRNRVAYSNLEEQVGGL